MKVVICDASPLIFLAKLDHLDLVLSTFEDPVVILECVVREVLSETAAPHEHQRLTAFLERVTRIEFEGSLSASKALSRSDRSTLTWAIENRASWLIADDRLLRRLARENRIPVVGFLGILLEAAKRGRIPPSEAGTAIDSVITDHDCRISISLYRQLATELKSL